MGLKIYRNYKNILSAALTGSNAVIKDFSGTEQTRSSYVYYDLYIYRNFSNSDARVWATDEDTHDPERYSEFTNIENITVVDTARGRLPGTPTFNENASYSHTFTITNNGNTDVTVKSLQLANDSYDSYPFLCFGYYFENGGLTVPANGTKVITISFANALSLN